MKKILNFFIPSVMAIFVFAIMICSPPVKSMTVQTTLQYSGILSSVQQDAYPTLVNSQQIITDQPVMLNNYNSSSSHSVCTYGKATYHNLNSSHLGTMKNAIVSNLPPAIIVTTLSYNISRLSNLQPKIFINKNNKEHILVPYPTPPVLIFQQ